MPTVNDIMQVAEALEKSPVVVVRDRCVAVRNRNATCRRCVAACLMDAIDVSGNEVHLDAGACVACGACTAVCPTEALVPVKPSDADLASAVVGVMANSGGQAVFACARIASRRLADPSRYAEVPCLARMEESLMVGLVARGASTVYLVDGTCETCKYGSCSPFVDEAVRNANELIAAQGSSVLVVRTPRFPEEMLVEDGRGLFGSTRRGFFSDAAQAARETAMAAAKTAIKQELGLPEDDASIGSRLRVTENGTLPRLDMPRHDGLINSMDVIGAPVVERIDSRRFASASINVQSCNACGMCAVFCPTGALRRGDGSVSAGLRFLEFSAADCVQCGLCADVCWKGALKLSSSVSTSQLFDFEPVVFDLARTKRPAKSPFDR